MAKISRESLSINEELWNKEVSEENYGANEQYQTHIFEQYKIFLETAQQTSARRNMANTFFLTLNTLIVGASGLLYEKGPQLTNKWFILFPLIAVLLLCYVWWKLITSYRQLNVAKFKVIEEYEKKLPSCPFVAAEWKALGEGKNPELFTPLTNYENWVPRIFACLYFLGALMFIFS